MYSSSSRHKVNDSATKPCENNIIFRSEFSVINLPR